MRDVPTRRHMQSLIVVQAGEVLVEMYFRDRRPDDLSNVHSVTKSFVAALAGIAIADGALSLETQLGEFFGDEAAVADDARKATITVRDLLSMTSGLNADSPHDIDEIADRGESWIRGVIAAPLVSDPGTTFSYNNGATHVLGALIAKAVGAPINVYAERRLFGPLGIHTHRWPRDPDGYALAYGHLEVRPRDLVAFGELHLGGRFRGEEIVPRSFVETATRAQSGGGPPESVQYGYLWWIAEDAGYSSFFAGGYGGQYITVVPDLALVVVSTGDVDVFIETSRNLRRLVAETVIPAIAG